MTTPTLEDIAGVLHEPVKGHDDERMPIGDAPAPKRRPRRAPATGGPGPKPRQARAPKAEVPMPRPGVIAEGVTHMYAFIGMGAMPFRPVTATTIMTQAEDLGKAWETLAASNPAVRRALLSLMQTSSVGVVVAAHVPIVLALMNENREIASAKRQADNPDSVSEAYAYAPGVGPEAPVGDVPAPVRVGARRARNNNRNNGVGQDGASS